MREDENRNGHEKMRASLTPNERHVRQQEFVQAVSTTSFKSGRILNHRKGDRKKNVIWRQSIHTVMKEMEPLRIPDGTPVDVELQMQLVQNE